MSSNNVGAVVNSEWIKVRSTLATMTTLPLGIAISIGIALLNGFSTRAAIDRKSAMLAPDFNPIDAGFVGLLYGNLAFVAFAVLVFSSEYTSGMIRASLAAVPQRGLFYLSKLGVAGAVCLLVGAVTAVVSFLSAQAGLGPHGVDLSAPGATRAVLCGIAYVTLLGVFAASVAALLRSTALSLGILMPLFFIVSPALGAIPGTKPVARFLPDQAGMQAMKATVGHGDLTPAQGLLVLVAWTVAAVLFGYWSIRRRDA
jgi:ABC-2 type transport system permease protein